MTKIVPCPFVFADGRKCTGHITRVEAYKCDVAWIPHDGKWRPAVTEIRTHYQLFCSEEDGHGTSPDDNSGMKFYRKHLPESLALTCIGEPD
jgi:hypothetical protein